MTSYLVKEEQEEARDIGYRGKNRHIGWAFEQAAGMLWDGKTTRPAPGTYVYICHALGRLYKQGEISNADYDNARFGVIGHRLGMFTYQGEAMWVPDVETLIRMKFREDPSRIPREHIQAWRKAWCLALAKEFST